MAKKKIPQPIPVVPTEPVTRTLKHVEDEMAQLCVDAGAKQYNITIYQKELELLNERLSKLTDEQRKLKAMNEKSSV